MITNVLSALAKRETKQNKTTKDILQSSTCNSLNQQTVFLDPINCTILSRLLIIFLIVIFPCELLGNFVISFCRPHYIYDCITSFVKVYVSAVKRNTSK
jgi:hypothetical protein